MGAGREEEPHTEQEGSGAEGGGEKGAGRHPMRAGC